jgi:RNA polymerase sigma-70 factor (ECF subfamily)
VTEETDEALVARYRRGDVTAFEALLDRHRRGVFRFLCRFVGDTARADDLAQDCWLRFIGAAPRWKDGGLFRTWLYAVARNLATDAARRARFREHRSLDAVPADGRRSRDAGDPPAVAPEGDVLLRSTLERAIALLPDEQREVFLLREVEGITFAEIAEVTGAPVPTVKSRMRYALEALRSTLEDPPGADVQPPGTRSVRA